MPDITKRLREFTFRTAQQNFEDAIEAADEIERLQSQISRIAGLMDSANAALSIAISEATEK